VGEQVENKSAIASNETPQVAGEPANPPTEVVVETTEDTGESVEKSRTARRFNALLQEKARLEQELEQVRRSAPSQPVAAQPAPSTPVADSPEYWQKKYQEATNLQEQQEAWSKWMEVRDKRLLATSEQQILNRLQQKETQKVVFAKFHAVHETHPFLSQDAQGQLQVNPEAPVVKAALRQAQEDGMQISNDAMLLYYLQTAKAELTAAERDTANKRVTTLENRVQQNGARSISTPRNVSPERNPSAAEAQQVAELEKRSSLGDADATRELIRLRL
jgi:hypothetical protein